MTPMNSGSLALMTAAKSSKIAVAPPTSTRRPLPCSAAGITSVRRCGSGRWSARPAERSSGSPARPRPSRPAWTGRAPPRPPRASRCRSVSAGRGPRLSAGESDLGDEQQRTVGPGPKPGREQVVGLARRAEAGSLPASERPRRKIQNGARQREHHGERGDGAGWGPRRSGAERAEKPVVWRSPAWPARQAVAVGDAKEMGRRTKPSIAVTRSWPWPSSGTTARDRRPGQAIEGAQPQDE